MQINRKGIATMWYYLYIEDYIQASIVSKQLMDELFALMVFTKNPSLCIFSRRDSKSGGEHIYFAPGTETIAKKHNAKSCERPSRQDAGTLIAGNQAVVDSLLS
jgi:hypothetical protein